MKCNILKSIRFKSGFLGLWVGACAMGEDIPKPALESAAHTHYVQQLDYQPHDQLQATLAQKGLTRLFVVGDRLVSLFVEENLITQVADEVSGQWFIQLKNPEHTQSIALSIITEKGYAQDLLLKVDDIPSAAIQVTMPSKELVIEEDTDKLQAACIPRLLKAVMQGKVKVDPTRWFPKRVKRSLKWELHYLREYSMEGWQISEWRVRNVSHKLLTLKETDFYEQGDRALSVMRYQIGRGASTQLWIVRRRL